MNPYENLIEGKKQELVRAYHQRTKHEFSRYAKGPGYLDWNTQPNPFRRFDGSPRLALPLVTDQRTASYADLFNPDSIEAAPLDLQGTSVLLQLSFGLAAWKQYGGERWALRCNPSSGNLHPTEAYLIAGKVAGLASGIHHYVSHDHCLEHRCRFDPSFQGLLVGLSSIHWREAWKYGERAFRYCQHDVGHALGALRYAAAVLGWRVRMLDAFGDGDIAVLLGLDRSEDFTGAEPESPDVLCLIEAEENAMIQLQIDELLNEARAGCWMGLANRLSARHEHDWPAIEEASIAARKPRSQSGKKPTQEPAAGSRLHFPTTSGRRWPEEPAPDSIRGPDEGERSHGSKSSFAGRGAMRSLPELEGLGSTSLKPGGGQNSQDNRLTPPPTACELPAVELIKQRRSAQAFDGVTSITAKTFFRILDATLPRPNIPPFDAWNWPPRVHLILFVHRVLGLPPGLYVFCRHDEALQTLRTAIKPEFNWETAEDCPAHLPLIRLMRCDARQAAKALSCHQDIAGDSSFSLGMLAEFDAGLSEGPWVYRRLFWECGLIGQALYLEAEAAGVRGTGIGCFFDDPVHELLGLQGTKFQSLYHFTIGGPLVDTRLQSLPGYWHLQDNSRQD